MQITSRIAAVASVGALALTGLTGGMAAAALHDDAPGAMGVMQMDRHATPRVLDNGARVIVNTPEMGHAFCGDSYYTAPADQPDCHDQVDRWAGTL